jgi:hypothetical protein
LVRAERADIQGVADAHAIAAVERRRRGQVGEFVVAPQRFCDCGRLGAPRWCSWPRDQRDAIDHDRGVLDEAAIGTGLVGRDQFDARSACLKRRAIRRVLSQDASREP